VNAHETAAFRMFSQDDAGVDIEDTALPLTAYYGISLLVFLFLTILISQLAIGEFSLRTLGDRRFGELIFFWICLFIAMILADTLQFSRTWSRLRRLLIFMDRLRLRRTLEALKGLSWDSVWKMSGNVLEQRYRLISRQFESMSNLSNILHAWQPAEDQEKTARSIALQQLKRCGHSGTLFADWYVNLGHSSRATDLTDLRNFQRELAAAAGCVMTTIILPAWHKETQSLILDSTISTDTSKWDEAPDQPGDDKDGNLTEAGHKTPADVAASERKTVVQAAEEFFVLPYLGFSEHDWQNSLHCAEYSDSFRGCNPGHFELPIRSATDDWRAFSGYLLAGRSGGRLRLCGNASRLDPQPHHQQDAGRTGLRLLDEIDCLRRRPTHRVADHLVPVDDGFCGVVPAAGSTGDQVGQALSL